MGQDVQAAIRKYTLGFGESLVVVAVVVVCFSFLFMGLGGMRRVKALCNASLCCLSDDTEGPSQQRVFTDEAAVMQHAAFESGDGAERSFSEPSLALTSQYGGTHNRRILCCTRGCLRHMNALRGVLAGPSPVLL